MGPPAAEASIGGSFPAAVSPTRGWDPVPANGGLARVGVLILLAQAETEPEIGLAFSGIESMALRKLRGPWGGAAAELLWKVIIARLRGPRSFRRMRSELEGRVDLGAHLGNGGRSQAAQDVGGGLPRRGWRAQWVVLGAIWLRATAFRRPRRPRSAAARGGCRGRAAREPPRRYRRTPPAPAGTQLRDRWGPLRPPRGILLHHFVQRGVILLIPRHVRRTGGSEEARHNQCQGHTSISDSESGYPPLANRRK